MTITIPSFKWLWKVDLQNFKDDPDLISKQINVFEDADTSVSRWDWLDVDNGILAELSGILFGETRLT